MHIWPSLQTLRPISKTTLAGIGSGFQILLVVLGLIALVGWLSATPAHAASQSPGNRAAQQVILPVPPAQVMEVAGEAFTNWKRGELIEVDPEKQEIKGLSRTNFFKFVDDITVAIQPLETDPKKNQNSITSV